MLALNKRGSNMPDFGAALTGPLGFPEQQQALAAKTRALQIVNQGAALHLQQYEKMGQMLQQQGLQGDNPSDQLFHFAQIAAKAGDPDAAIKAIQAGELSGYHAAMAMGRMISAKAQETRARAAAVTQSAQTLAAEAPLIHDQASLTSWANKWNATVGSQGGVQVDPNTPYSPQVVQQFRNMGMNAYQQGILAHDRATEAQAKAHNGVMEGIAQLNAKANQVRAEAAASNAQISREREDRIQKAGGKRPAGVPSLQAINNVKMYLAKEFPDMPTTDLYEAASETASATQTLMRQNPALSYNEALQRALVETRKRVGQSGGFLGFHQTPTYKSSVESNIPEAVQQEADSYLSRK